MKEEIIKRGYNIPEKLLKEWEFFHRPSKDYSPSAAGAFLVWMALPPDIREEAKRLAHNSDIKQAIKKIQHDLSRSLRDQMLKQWLAGMTPEQYDTLLAYAEQAEKKISGKS